MARARNIKPGFFKNEHLAAIPMEARMLFIGLWAIADKSGRLEDRPARIKAEIFPYDPIDVERCLAYLAAAPEGAHPFLERYTVNGGKYIQIVNWDKHQNPHKNETDSGIPAKIEDSRNFSSTSEKLGETREDSSNGPSDSEKIGSTRADSLIPSSLIPSSHDSQKSSMSSGEGDAGVKAKASKIPPGVKVPETLIGDKQFRSLIEDWARYLFQRNGRVHAMTFESHLKQFVTYGFASSKKAVESAIDKTWAAPDWNCIGMSSSRASPSEEEAQRRLQEQRDRDVKVY